jgi:hypothetical protein
MPHSWWCIIGALVAVGLSATRTAAQTPESASPTNHSSDGSVLRLVSGIAGREGYEPEPEATLEPDATFEPTPDNNLPDGPVPRDSAAPRRWLNPYEIGTPRPDFGQDWNFLPPGMVPFFGPRTPKRYRHQNLGEPLKGASWLNRPFGAGWFVGGISGTPLINHHVNQDSGLFGGYRLTWDYDYYWGLETRLGGAAIGVHDVTRPTIPRTSDLVQWDTDLLYYPWGDSRWRPYWLTGLGFTSFHFSDDKDVFLRKSLVVLPWGIGIKYRVHEYLVARFELIDNWAIGSGRLSAMQNVSYTCGVEIRFGGVRRHYWPWDPGRHLW